MKKTKVTIWAPDYNPFILGGDVNAPMACEVEAEGPFPLGKGYKGFLVTSPKGKTFVAESKTGAIVGSTLKMVRDDIKAAKPSVMKKQVEDAAKLFKRARHIGPKEFWAKMEKRS